MRNSSNLSRIFGFLALAVGLGLLVGWWASRDGDLHPKTFTNNASLAEPSAVIKPLVKPVVSNAVEIEATADATPPPEPVQQPTWEDKLEEILLNGDIQENQKAEKILALINTPDMPEEAQVELSQHLINLVQDDNYDGAAQLLTNSTTPSAVASVLMNDLLNRNNNLKLPMLLDIARNEYHPLKGEAKEMLELFLQEDNGTNWTQWDTSVQTWLKDNPQ